MIVTARTSLETRLPRWLRGKESTCQCRRHGFYPWVKKIPLEKEMATYPCLENPMDRGAWQAAVHGVTKRVRHNLATKKKKQKPQQWYVRVAF